MGSTYVPQGTTTKLTPLDESASTESAYKNMEQQAFREWPNEAGVRNPPRFLLAAAQCHLVVGPN